MDIFDWSGPEFLTFYIVLLIACVVAGVIWRRGIAGQFSQSEPPPNNLDAFEVAYMAGNKGGLAAAVLASLVHRGIATVVSKKTVTFAAAALADLYPLEQQVLRATMPGKTYTIKEIREMIDDEPLRQNLQSMGLILPPEQGLIATLNPALLMVAVLAIGIIKVGVGISRGKNTAFLVILCVVTIFAIIGFSRKASRTKRGTLTLDTIRRSHATLESTARADATALDPAHAVLALALWGPAVLGGMAFSPLRDALVAQAASGGGCGGGSSCGGGGCGGGCGGCGG